ncbi:MAG: aldehyde dehydrogenase family protein [Lysobacterales bacterium]|jgi:acyl-CoA reductase-like NAD-dependent aldehyde dehydrogenase
MNMSLEQIGAYDRARWSSVAEQARSGCWWSAPSKKSSSEAGIWTWNLNKAMRLVKDFEAGVVWINNYEDGDMTQPFGGYKQSGHARDKCMDSLKSYTQGKSAWFRLAPE